MHINCLELPDVFLAMSHFLLFWEVTMSWSEQTIRLWSTRYWGCITNIYTCKPIVWSGVHFFVTESYSCYQYIESWGGPAVQGESSVWGMETFIGSQSGMEALQRSSNGSLCFDLQSQAQWKIFHLHLDRLALWAWPVRG